MSPTAGQSSSSSADLSGQAKLEEVTRLMDILSSDLIQANLLPRQRDANLEKLKILGRDPSNADPICTKEGIETLTRHAFNSPSKMTSHNALRCLANAMLLKASTRQIFVDLGYEAKACSQLENDDRDDEFLISRIIFLTTYDSNVNIEKLIDQHKLADSICVNLRRHAMQYSTKQQRVKPVDPMEDMALIESLKLLFNITHFCPQRNESFSPAIPHILRILCHRPILTNRPLEAPIGPLVNSLINLPLQQGDNVVALFPKTSPNLSVERLIDILNKAIRVYRDEELEQMVSPLLTLLGKVYELAPNEVRIFMESLILPSQEDRKQPLGRADSLSARLLRLSTSVTGLRLRESISSLLFDMSGRDAKTFVQNVGYGFASGFLFQHNVPMPENALDPWSTTNSEIKTTKTSQENQKPVNPITGQTLESEPQSEMPEMSQEEKEREAEKMFVLFERLNKTGVMRVKNPVETAFQEGRLTELDDDADSE